MTSRTTTIVILCVVLPCSLVIGIAVSGGYLNIWQALIGCAAIGYSATLFEWLVQK